MTDDHDLDRILSITPRTARHQTPAAAGMSEAQQLAELDAMALAGAEGVIAAAKADGRMPLQVAGEVLQAHKRHLARNGRPGYGKHYTPPSARSIAATPEGWGAEYDASADLQAEFTSREAYVALRTAEAAGKVRVLAPGASRGNAAPVFVTVAMRDAWRAEWQANGALQAEFSTAEIYRAYREGEATGRIRHR